MSAVHVPVLIVGAGVAGLATSTLLAEHGVRSLLVEKRREIFIYPKARNLSFRSLEILRGLGLGDQIHAVADRVSDMVVKPTLNSAEENLAIDIHALFAGLDLLSPEPAVQYCPQSGLEPILLAETRRRGSEVRYGTELRSFEQDDTGVTVVLRDLESGVEQMVRADFLIAADGVHSKIRESLDITTSGYGALPIFVVFIYFRAPWRRFVPHLSEGDGVQVKNPDADGIFLVAKDDLGMFITTYFPDKGETAAQFTPQYCSELLTNAIGEQIDLEIIEAAAWQPYEQVADQFQSGRVFLVGDSGHTMPPFKAGGANTAIQSAHNLAWKLAAVLGGTADPALLASYHAERHPVGKFAARQSLTGPTVALIRSGRPESGIAAGRGGVDVLPADRLPIPLGGSRFRSAGTGECRCFVTGGAVGSSARNPSASCVGATRGSPRLDARPGRTRLHAFHRIVRYDLGNRGRRGIRHDACPDPRALHSSDGEIRDIDGRWVHLTGLSPDEALLVRPDGFVAWRTGPLPPSPENCLSQVLRQILGLASTRDY